MLLFDFQSYPFQQPFSWAIIWNWLHAYNFNLGLGPIEFYLKTDVLVKEMFVHLHLNTTDEDFSFRVSRQQRAGL